MAATRWWTIRGPLSTRLYWTLAVAGLLLPLLLWIAASTAEWVAKVFLPSPWAVLERAWGWLVRDELLSHIGISVYRVCAGFALSALIAIPLGLWIGTHRHEKNQTKGD